GCSPPSYRSAGVARWSGGGPMGMVASLEVTAARLDREVAALDPECLSAEAALAGLEPFARIAKLADTGRTLGSRRIDECGIAAPGTGRVPISRRRVLGTPERS